MGIVEGIYIVDKLVVVGMELIGFWVGECSRGGGCVN